MTDAEALRALLARIEDTFGRDVDSWLTCFDDPLVILAERTVVSTHAEARAAFGAMADALIRRGFASTAADEVRIRVVSNTMALVDAAFTRRRADGSVLERVGAMYVARRDPDAGWRFAALVPHPPETAALADPAR